MEKSYNSLTFNMQYHDLINQSPHGTTSAVVSPETVNNSLTTVATVDSSTPINPPNSFDGQTSVEDPTTVHVEDPTTVHYPRNPGDDPVCPPDTVVGSPITINNADDPTAVCFPTTIDSPTTVHHLSNVDGHNAVCYPVTVKSPSTVNSLTNVHSPAIVATSCVHKSKVH